MTMILPIFITADSDSDVYYFRFQAYSELFLHGSADGVFKCHDVGAGCIAVGIYQYQRLLLPYTCTSGNECFASGVVDEPGCRQFYISCRENMAWDGFVQLPLQFIVGICTYNGVFEETAGTACLRRRRELAVA